MARFAVLGIATLLALSNAFHNVEASCKMKNTLEYDDTLEDLEKESFCRNQGEGHWTFTMDTTAIDVPTFNGGSPWTGYVSTAKFIIYDNHCNVKGIYAQPDCEIPYWIAEDFLPYVLTITSINTATGYYAFPYANGLYSINNNHCNCHDVSHGVTGEQTCVCAFPIHGEPS